MVRLQHVHDTTGFVSTYRLISSPCTEKSSLGDTHDATAKACAETRTKIGEERGSEKPLT